MTFDDLRKLGEACLSDYKPRLKVLGKMDYDKKRGPVKILKTNERSLDSFSEEEMRHEVSAVLDQLATLEEGFFMSGPEVLNSPCNIEMATVLDGDLCLPFAYGWEIRTLTPLIHIVCYYYPVQVGRGKG
jgi:hypothetical protein